MRSKHTMRVIRHSILLVILCTIFMTSTYSFAESRFPVLALADANGINTSATVQTNYSGMPRVIGVDVPPQTINGKTMLPARVLVENLGGQIRMSTDGKVLTIIYGGETKKVICDPKTNTFTYNGQPLSAVIKDNRTLMGLRDVCEKVLNVDKVDWYNPGKQAYVLDKGKVFVAKIDSKQITIMDEPNTYAAAQVKVAMYADSKTKSIIYADLASGLGMGSANAIAFIDGRSGAAVQYVGSLKETYQDETGLLEQAAFTTRFNQLSQTNPELFNSSNTFFVDKEHFYVINPTTNTLNIDGTKNITLPPNLSIDVITGIVTDSSNGAKLNAGTGAWVIPPVIMSEAQKAIVKQALKYRAGGEWIEPTTITNPVEKLPNGICVIYSSEANKAKEKAIALKVKSPTTIPGTIDFACGGYYCTKKLNIDYGKGSSSCVSNAWKVNTDGSIKNIQFDAEGRYSTLSKKSSLFTEPGLGLVLCGQGRITHKYNGSSFTELDTFVVKGTPEDRAAKYLNDILGPNYKNGIQNVFKLDSVEVKQYNLTHNSDGFKSFEVYKGIIITKESIIGFDDVLLNNIKMGIDVFDKFKILPDLRDQSLLLSITYLVKGGEDFFTKTGYAGTYDGDINTIQINKEIFKQVDPLYFALYALYPEAVAQGIQQFSFFSGDASIINTSKIMPEAKNNPQFYKYLKLKSLVESLYSDGYITLNNKNDFLYTVERGLVSNGYKP